METTTKRFIEDAVKGGWRESMEIDRIVVERPEEPGNPDFHFPSQVTLGHADSEWYTSVTSIVLDPAAWQAVGKVRGWKAETWHPTRQYPDGNSMTWPGYMPFWHKFIDHLADGKSIEEALAAIE